MKFGVLLLAMMALLSNVFADDRGFEVVLKEMKREPRVALVIGNKDYSTLGSLKNPINDARDMTAILTQKGFYVIPLENASQRQMEQAITQFANKIRSGKGVGLFYYAGHGVEVGGVNYLIPSDAQIPSIDFVKSKTVSVDSVLSAMERANNRFNILILDACRNDPFVRGGGGLAPINNATGVFVAYATSPGKVAEDGAGRNGLFTKYLKKYINQKGLKIEEVFKSVGKEVQIESGRRQTPWTSSSVYGDFYFTLPIPKEEPKPNPIVLKPLQELTPHFTPNFRVFSNIDQQKQNPLNARINIENVGVWSQGMKLKKGNYVVEVSASNYETKRYRIDVMNNNGYDFVLPFQMPKQKVASGSQWITPTRSVCESNGGEIDKYGCSSIWEDAKKICSVSQGTLPSEEILEQVIHECGGLMTWNRKKIKKNTENNIYQVCYKRKGFADNYYWSSTDENILNNAKGINFYTGHHNWYRKDLSNLYIRCIRIVK